MKKALLIATTLMALGLPAHAAQLTQVNQGHQDQLSKQAEPGQVTTTNSCLIRNGKIVCR